MTQQDVTVAQPPHDDDDAGRPARSLAEQLVEQARADGVGLVGPGGSLAALTKQVLEVEMEEHLGLLEARGGGPQRPQRDPTGCSARSPV
jgi:hypothetical protein